MGNGCNLKKSRSRKLGSPHLWKLGDKNIKFRSRLDFDREYLRNGTRCRQSENSVANYSGPGVVLIAIIDWLFRSLSVSLSVCLSVCVFVFCCVCLWSINRTCRPLAYWLTWITCASWRHSVKLASCSTAMSSLMTYVPPQFSCSVKLVFSTPQPNGAADIWSRGGHSKWTFLHFPSPLPLFFPFHLLHSLTSKTP